ncbi:DNA replication and repair protein RecO [Alteromonadaceae bacterium Bs31]|nr:DNA replication and repair protein RecO [Alteromonadaceae bacterium Bs31]
MKGPCVALVLMIKVERESAFVIHSRNYTDSRILLDVFTQNYGLVRAAYRPPKRKSYSIKPQAFTPLFVAFSGKSELKSIHQLEPSGNLLLPSGRRLYCGMYVNELVQRLLATDDPQPDLFLAYFKCISQLAVCNEGEEDIVLRPFEFALLSELGYGLDFSVDLSGREISTDEACHYEFVVGQGFRLIYQNLKEAARQFSGSELCAIQQGDMSTIVTRNASKRLCRLALRPLLGDKPLQSLELFS